MIKSIPFKATQQTQRGLHKCEPCNYKHYRCPDVWSKSNVLAARAATWPLQILSYANNFSRFSESKKPVSKQNKTSEDYKFLSKPSFVGKTIARKRKQIVSHDGNVDKQSIDESTKKSIKLTQPNKESDTEKNLQDLSENKGKYHGKSYQDLSDDIQTKQKPRSGGWISSLFKNNPEVPRIGQRAIKPLIEKVFTGNTFTDLDLHPHSVANLDQTLGLSELMAVQQQAIPVILQGRDVLIRSQTGSGKTLAYALPLIEGLQAIRPKINRNDGIRAVVVVPTRELAVQTYELFLKLVKPFTWLVPGLLSGGQKRKAEKARLRKGLSILVGTPGRINDHLRHTKSLNFAKTRCLVLDEADRLLDMGYEKDVAAIVKSIEDHNKAATYDPMDLIKQTVKKKIFTDEELETNKDSEITEIKHPLTAIFIGNTRQTILLSATLTKVSPSFHTSKSCLENLAGLTMVDPVFVDTSEGRAFVADSLNKTNNKQKNDTFPIKIEKNVSEKDDMNQEVKQDKQIIEEKQKKDEAKKGLKAFCGKDHPQLFSQNEIDAENIEKHNAVETDDSDSSSDYEYFKVQNKLNKKQEDDKQNESIQSSPLGNNFYEAVKSAVTEDELVLPATVSQTFLVVPMKLRLVTLCALIIEHCVLNKKGGKMIVFMATLEMVDYHTELLENVLTGEKVKKDNKKKRSEKIKKVGNTAASDDENVSSSSEEKSDSDYEIDYEAPSENKLVPLEIEFFKLHGSMPHEQRMEVFKQFREARTGILICTDVAARGLDVPRVDLVLQYCAPSSATDYVHRVGRTGRAAHAGAACMFLLPSEVEYVRHLEEKRIRLKQMDEREPLEALRALAPAAGPAHRAAIALQTRLEQLAHSDKRWLSKASRAYTSWVRFYSAYPREVRCWLDAKQLHLGHAAKAFALRDPPAALARRATRDPCFKRERPQNKLSVHDDEEKRRPGFPRVKIGTAGSMNKQSSMHTASEFDSGLPPLETKKKKK
ncbi:Probable ATP-dependent RNA helicase CG8611 [Eumeta japonica]|uniref:ATP-dependent RNA helicase n=1 Tax=Eumeta variegata TaxID=151549 RepID=A0A4C1X2N0_EUMVA|nr:Probable ATP-dependent RNA helicase CG8611 [Eumeta japonica]